MTDPQIISDQHIIVAIICDVGAMLVAGALLIWLAVEVEMRRKK